MATCINGRKGYRLCISQKCNEPAVLCRSEDCNCEDKHLNCRESLKVDLEISELNSRLVFRNQPTDKRLEEVLQRVRALPNAIPEGLKEWKAQVGLTSDQLRLLQQLAKPGQFSFSGSAVHKIDSLTPFPLKQAEQLVLRHLKNIQQMLASTEQALRILLTLKVDNPISPISNKKPSEPLQKPQSNSQTSRNQAASLQRSHLIIRDLQCHISSLSQQLDNSRKQIAKLSCQIAKYSALLTQSQHKNRAMRQQILFLEQKLAGTASNLACNDRLNSESTKKVEMLKMQNKQITFEVKKLSQANAQLQDALADRLKQLENFKKGVAAGNVKSDGQLAMRQQIEKLRKMLEKYAKEKEMLCKEIDMLKGELNMVLMDFERLKEQLDVQMMQGQKMKAELMKSKRMMEDGQERMKALEMESAKKTELIRELERALFETRKSH